MTMTTLIIILGLTFSGISLASSPFDPSLFIGAYSIDAAHSDPGCFITDGVDIGPAEHQYYLVETGGPVDSLVINSASTERGQYPETGKQSLFHHINTGLDYEWNLDNWKGWIENKFDGKTITSRHRTRFFIFPAHTYFKETLTRNADESLDYTGYFEIKVEGKTHCHLFKLQARPEPTLPERKL